MTDAPLEDAWRLMVQRALSAEGGAAVRRLVGKPFGGSSSHRIEELELELTDGTRLSLFAKDVGPVGLSRVARAVKPFDLLDPRREPSMYLGPLKSAGLGTARCYGLWEGPAGGRWLLLEKAPGKELFQWGEIEAWTAVSRWLARLHARFADAGESFPRGLGLLELDRAYLQRRMEAARAAVDRSPAERAAKEAFSALCDRYSEWIERSQLSFPTLLHGDFYPANIVVDGGKDSVLRICPVDWEMASWGPGAADLAALTSGAWSAGQRNRICEAYLDEADHLDYATPPDFEKALQAWRLHVAVQWIGWSADWTPPPEQRHDWLREALGF